MSNLMIKGKINIFGIEVPNIYGGFGANQKIILAKTIAEIHGREVFKINELINNNRSKFIDGVHILDLKNNAEVVIFLKDNGIMSQNAINRSENIYALSQRGYARLLKIMDDDVAWEKWDIIENEYFELKEASTKPMSQLEILVQAAQALFEQDKAIKQLEYKQEQQEGKIKELTAKVKTIPDEYYSIAGYASLRGMKVDINKAGLLGRKASKLSKEYDTDVGKVYDPRFGQVNTYHLDVLKEVFAGLQQEIA